MTKKRSIDLMKYSRVILLVVIAVVMCLTTPEFRTMSNLDSVLTQQVPYLFLISAAMAMSLILGTIDLSIGSVMGLSACVAGYIFFNYENYMLGILAAFGVAIIFGLTNGLLVTKVKVPPFIVTYGMDWIAKGFAYVLLAGSTVFGFSDRFRFIATGNIFGLPNLLWIMITVLIISFLVLNKSTFGRKFYASGINREATKLSGVNTDSIIIISYVINAILAAITGLLYIARMDVAEGALCEGWTMPMFAAVLIGGTPMTGGEGGVVQTLIGVVIMVVIKNALNIMGVSSLWQSVAIGIVIFFAIILEVVNKKVSELAKAY